MRSSWLYLATRSVREAEPVLIWPVPDADHEIGDEGVFGFAGAVRDDGGVSGAARHLDGFDGFGHRADLIQLDQDRIADVFGDAALQARGVGDEEVVADELDLLAEDAGQVLPAAQSSSARPSSRETMGYCRTQDSQKAAICSGVREDLSDFLKT